MLLLSLTCVTCGDRNVGSYNFKLDAPTSNVYTLEDEILLKRIAWAENNADLRSLGHVMQVVENRVKSNNFPNSVREVIFQEGQFSPTFDGRFWNVRIDFDKVDEAYEMFLNGEFKEEVCEATYFVAKGYEDWHERDLNFIMEYKGHRFYK